MNIYRIAFRNVRRHKARTALSGSAIVLASLFIVFLFSLIAMMDPVYQSSKVLDIIESMDGVAIATERIAIKSLFQVDGVDYYATAMGLDFEKEKIFQNLDKEIVLGSLPRLGEGEMLMNRKIAEDSKLLSVEETLLPMGIFDKILNLKTGYVPIDIKYSLNNEKVRETAFFMVGRGMQAATLKLSGIVQFRVASLNRSNFVLPIEDLRRYIKRDDISSEILVKLDGGIDSQVFAKELQGKLDDIGRSDLAVRSWKDAKTMYSWVVIAEGIYYVIAAIFFLIGSVVIVNTTIMVIYERMKEIGTLAAMGFDGKQLVLLFFIESLIIGTIGSAIGVLLGVLISAILSVTGIPLGSAMEGIEFDVSTIIYTRITWGSTVVVFFYSVAVSAMATFIPSLRAARISPVEALRSI